MYLETVAAYLGISRMTWRVWLKRGAKEARRIDKGENPDLSEALYLEFFDVFQKGIAEGELHDAGVLKKAAAGTLPTKVKKVTHPDGSVTEETTYADPQWTAAAWRLERRFAERWGRDRSLLIQLAKDLKELRRERGAEDNEAGPVAEESAADQA
jgi:hypothetical protein